jgi:hypothetical protein
MKEQITQTLEYHSGQMQALLHEMELSEPLAVRRSPEAAERMQENYLDLVRHNESLSGNIRELLLRGYGDMEAAGLAKGRPVTYVMTDDSPVIDIDGRMIRITFESMLPGRLKGYCHYLHKKLDIGIARALARMGNPLIRFPRAAVVFIHKFAPDTVQPRHLKDYDNRERVCIMNTLVKYFLDDDSCRHVFTMDVAVKGLANQTDVYLMEPQAFFDFLTQLDYSLYGEDLRKVMENHA